MTEEYLLKLGEFKFALPTLAYQTLRRSWKFNWQLLQRLGQYAAPQFVGLGAETIDLQGVIYPQEFGNPDQIKSMALRASDGVPLLLFSGTGEKMGYWVINSISENDSLFVKGGGARKISFSIRLTFYGDSYAGAV